MKEFDLDKLEKRTLYRVPDKFFDTFPDCVMRKIALQRRRRLMWRITTVTAIAALFSGVVFLFHEIPAGRSSQDSGYSELVSNISNKTDVYVSSLSDEELAEQYSFYASDATLLLYDEE